MRRFPKRDFSGPYVGWGSLDGNHHGPKVDGKAMTLRSTAMVVYLDNGMMPPPRFNWGVRLWLYARSGRCWSFDAGWRSTRRHALSDAERDRRGKAYVEQLRAIGAWPPKLDEGPDFLGAMLGAHGLGLTVREGPVP